MIKIALSKPHFNDFKDDLNKCQISVYGNNLVLFENKLEFYLKSNAKVACLNSGTSAIHLALILTGVTKGDEVLCQSFTFSASANPIVYQGAKPIFIDSELETWNMCPVALEEAIKDRIAKNKKPKAIILVHLYGMPARIEQIVAIANTYEIALIEDAAEALGSTYKGQKCGTFGDFGIWLGVMLFVSYLLLADGLFNGRSIGKIITKTRVVVEVTGKPCGFFRSFVRNVALSVLGIFDWIFILGNDRKRLGDMLAGTIVVNVHND